MSDEDRRVRNTKKKIRKALMECLETTSLSKLTIKQICEKADINRSTWYAYYTEPVLLYKLIQDDFFGGMNPFFEDLESGFISYETFLYALLEFFLEHRKEVITMMRSDLESFQQTYIEKSSQYEVIRGGFSTSDKEYIREFYVSGSIRIIYRWLSNGAEQSVEYMARLMIKMLTAL